MNINSLKISKFFWEKITLKSKKNGQMSVILVKKNLFNSYSVVDQNGIRHTLASSEITKFFEDYSKIDSTKTLFYSPDEIKNSNQKYKEEYDKITEKQTKYEELKGEVERLHGVISKLKDENTKLIRENAHNEEKFQTDYLAQKESLINILKDSLQGPSIDYTIEGVEVAYQNPNDMQKKYYGVSSDTVIKPYKIEGKFSIDLEEYFRDLNSSTNHLFDGEIKVLISMLSNLRVEIGKLENNFSYEDYVLVTSHVNDFINKFIELTVSCYDNYGNNEVKYSDSLEVIDTNGYKKVTTYSCDNLLQVGRDLCANMVGKIMGMENQNGYLDSFNFSSNRRMVS